MKRCQAALAQERLDHIRTMRECDRALQLLAQAEAFMAGFEDDALNEDHLAPMLREIRAILPMEACT